MSLRFPHFHRTLCGDSAHVFGEVMGNVGGWPCLPPSPSSGNDEKFTCVLTFSPHNQRQCLSSLAPRDNVHQEKEYVEAEAVMRKALITLKREGSSILEEAAGAGRAIAAAESLRPLPMVEILQDIRLLAPQRERGQQMPQVGSGDLTAQKNKRRQERDRR